MGDHKLGICRWCEEKTEVFKDNGLCDDCDSDTVYCVICKQHQHRDDRCRHVFQDRYFEWCGAGVGPHPTPAVRASIFNILDLMPAGFSDDLTTAIRSGKFYTWIVAPLIGGGGILELNGMPNRNGRSMVIAWGDALIKLGESDDADLTADAYRDAYCWLASLYQRSTRQANKTTLALLAEWEKRDMNPDCIAAW